MDIFSSLLNCIVFLLLGFNSCLYIWESRCLSDVPFANISPQSISFSFDLLTSYFAE
jgi:hypothetical protein